MIARKGQIEAGRLPMYIEVGYFDQVSPRQALPRFDSFSNSQTLVIGPISHGGYDSTDPFRPGQSKPDPAYRVQVVADGGLLRPLSDSDNQAAPVNSVTYYVLNGHVWRTAPRPGRRRPP